MKEMCMAEPRAALASDRQDVKSDRPETALRGSVNFVRLRGAVSFPSQGWHSSTCTLWKVQFFVCCSCAHGTSHGKRVPAVKCCRNLPTSKSSVRGDILLLQAGVHDYVDDRAKCVS